jgi:endonuclease/exonuclease/phosphatase (EEP) superfamily protein YafD
MATLTVRCSCGEQYHADDASIGRRIRCRRCKQTLVLERGKPAAGTPPITPKPQKIRRRKRQQQASEGSSQRHRIIMPTSRLARVVTWLAWAYLAAVCVVAALMWLLGDRTTIGTVLLFMGRWVFLLPLLMLVPAALYYRRFLLLPLLAAALVAAGPVMGARTGWRRLLPTPTGTHVRVVSFNTDAADLFAQLLPDLLIRWQPDVVAFQECGELLTDAVRLTAGWNHYESKDLCLLSRYPIRSVQVMDRSALDRVKQSEVKEFGGAGYVQRFVLDGPRGPIRVGNVHLETPRKGLEGLMEGDLRRLDLNTQVREIESNMARAWVSEGTGPLLVLGDFNTPVESAIFRDHWGDLADAFSTAGTGLGMTKYNGWIRARIDHVLASSEWHVDRATVGADARSDHRPLIVDLTLVGK